MTDLLRLEPVCFGCFIQTCQEIKGSSGEPASLQASKQLMLWPCNLAKLPKLPSCVQRKGVSRCPPRAVTSLQALMLQSEKGENDLFFSV